VDAWLHLPFNKGGYVTFNAISSTSIILFGVLCGELLRSQTVSARKLLTLLATGLGGLLAGSALTPMVPMVKRLWTASFAVYAAGWTYLMLAAFYGVMARRCCNAGGSSRRT
jgi:predicted acyltransferase